MQTGSWFSVNIGCQLKKKIPRASVMIVRSTNVFICRCSWWLSVVLCWSGWPKHWLMLYTCTQLSTQKMTPLWQRQLADSYALCRQWFLTKIRLEDQTKGQDHQLYTGWLFWRAVSVWWQILSNNVHSSLIVHCSYRLKFLMINILWRIAFFPIAIFIVSFGSIMFNQHDDTLSHHFQLPQYIAVQ